MASLFFFSQTEESLEKKSRAVTGQASVNEAKLFREQWGSVRECRVATGHSPLLLYKTQSGLWVSRISRLPGRGFQAMPVGEFNSKTGTGL